MGKEDPISHTVQSNTHTHTHTHTLSICSLQKIWKIWKSKRQWISSVTWPVIGSVLDISLCSLFWPLSLMKDEALEGCPLWMSTCSLLFLGSLQSKSNWASLVAQWWRIYLPVQKTGVWSLIWEYSTCFRVTKPVPHNFWPCALETLSPTSEPTCCNTWSPLARWSLHCKEGSYHSERPKQHNLDSSPHSLQIEKSLCNSEDPVQPK